MLLFLLHDTCLFFPGHVYSVYNKHEIINKTQRKISLAMGPRIFGHF